MNKTWTTRLVLTGLCVAAPLYQTSYVYAEEKSSTVSNQSTLGATLEWTANGAGGFAPSGGALRLQHKSGWAIEPSFGVLYTQADDPLNQWSASLRLRAPLMTRSRTRLNGIASLAHSRTEPLNSVQTRSTDLRWGLGLERWLSSDIVIGIDATSSLATSSTFGGDTTRALGPGFAPEFKFLATLFL